MPVMKGLLAPQNTFLDTIATRFDGTRESGLGLRTPGEGDARGALRVRGEIPLPSAPGVSLVAEAGNEQGEARELPTSPARLPGFSAALQTRRAPGPLRLRSPSRGLRGGRSPAPCKKVALWTGVSPAPRAAERPPGKGSLKAWAGL